MFSLLVSALLIAQEPAPQAPARPFGTAPAWPAGDISSVLVPAAPGNVSQAPSPATPRAETSTRVRAPFRQAEQPVPTDLEALRRQQQARVREPGSWRQDQLPSDRQAQRRADSVFRETPLGPQPY